MENLMKAMYYEQYGPPDVLRLAEVEKPTPGDDELLVKIHSASINYVDWEVMRGESLLLRLMNGLRKPNRNIPGDDFAGEIEAVGNNIEQLNPGDHVFGLRDTGTFAEYCCVAKDVLAKKPQQVTFQQAAAIPTAGLTALQGIRDRGKIRDGQKVLIVGASGGVGTYAVQLAKYFGAEVTGICSTAKTDALRSLGADHVIDYTKDDFKKADDLYDLVFAVSGSNSIFAYRKILKRDGKFVCAGGSASQYFQGLLLGPLLSMLGDQKLGSMYTSMNRKDLEFLAGLIETGRITAVIDRQFPLGEVPDALRYFGGGSAFGKIVINMN
jgi:NADPH:quinone reductase-like Zn-dependent oxidoreductase